MKQSVEFPGEVFAAHAPAYFPGARDLGYLALASKTLNTASRSPEGRLRVHGFLPRRLAAVFEGLKRVDLNTMEVLQVDLRDERFCTRKEIEMVVRSLADALASTTSLRALAVRFAGFTDETERLRLTEDTWKALILGLDAVADYRRLQSLSLSSIAIKESRAVQAIAKEESQEREQRVSRSLRRGVSAPASPGQALPVSVMSPSFLNVLSRLDGLQELRLTHAEIFEGMARLLPSVLNGLPELREVDLTRNHIPPRAMEEVRSQLKPCVELSGIGMQTFYSF